MPYIISLLRSNRRIGNRNDNDLKCPNPKKINSFAPKKTTTVISSNIHDLNGFSLHEVTFINVCFTFYTISIATMYVVKQSFAMFSRDGFFCIERMRAGETFDSFDRVIPWWDVWFEHSIIHNWVSLMQRQCSYLYFGVARPTNTSSSSSDTHASVFRLSFSVGRADAAQLVFISAKGERCFFSNIPICWSKSMFCHCGTCLTADSVGTSIASAHFILCFSPTRQARNTRVKPVHRFQHIEKASNKKNE